MQLPLIASLTFNLLFIIVIIALSNRQQKQQLTQEQQLSQYWKETLRPPRIEDKVYVYVSSPLFNLSEIIYSVGIEGIMPENHISLIDTLCNINEADRAFFRGISDAAGIPRYGIAGAIAEKGWYSYVPARDGFVLAKFIGALYAPECQDLLKQNNTDIAQVSGYLTKAIYAFDVFALSSLCNSCIFNSNGLQIDDGSAAEIGMIGVRGMPAVYLRNQATEQFGPGASNPMPLGNANSLINQRAFSVKDAINLLDQKIKNIMENQDQWWSGMNYDSEVCPPPLIMFWIEVGESVFNVRYRSRDIVVDSKTGFQDYKASSTDFFYQNYYFDQNGNPAGSNLQLTQISLEIMKGIQQVENKWQDFMMTYGACNKDNRDFSKVITLGCPY